MWGTPSLPELAHAHFGKFGVEMGIRLSEWDWINEIKLLASQFFINR